MKYFALIFSLLFVLSVQAQTPRNIDTYDFQTWTTIDTLTDTVTTIVKWDNYANWPMTYGWRLWMDYLDTSAVTVYFQESPLTNPSSAYPSADWYTVGTWTNTFTADKDTILNFTSTYGRSARCVFVNTGPGQQMIYVPSFAVKRHISSNY